MTSVDGSVKTGTGAFDELLDLYRCELRHSCQKRVLQVYRGKSNTCYCGCAGDYAVTTLGFSEGHGMAEAANDKRAMGRLAKMVRLAGTCSKVEAHDGMSNERYIVVTYPLAFGDEDLTVYFKREVA